LENREVNQAPCRYAEIISLSTFKDKLKNFLLLNTLVWACVSGVQADEFFTAAEFLKRQEAHQKFWIEGAVDAYAQVASAKSNDKGRCVMAWYYGEQHAQRNSLIFASMRKYSDKPPRAVLLALIERSCGVIRK
tara:strand:+ start:274 stop:675 length:402 start_codon:yes stop_codon:yes gene_type:complete